jgi:hypothetical protein
MTAFALIHLSIQAYQFYLAGVFYERYDHCGGPHRLRWAGFCIGSALFSLGCALWLLGVTK